MKLFQLDALSCSRGFGCQLDRAVFTDVSALEVFLRRIHRHRVFVQIDLDLAGRVGQSVRNEADANTATRNLLDRDDASIFENHRSSWDVPDITGERIGPGIVAGQQVGRGDNLADDFLAGSETRADDLHVSSLYVLNSL